MANATPVSAEAKAKKPAGVSAEVAAQVAATDPAPNTDTQRPYKVEGGVELANHKAVREDF